MSLENSIFWIKSAVVSKFPDYVHKHITTYLTVIKLMFFTVDGITLCSSNKVKSVVCIFYIVLFSAYCCHYCVKQYYNIIMCNNNTRKYWRPYCTLLHKYCTVDYSSTFFHCLYWCKYCTLIYNSIFSAFYFLNYCTLHFFTVHYF